MPLNRAALFVLFSLTACQCRPVEPPPRGTPKLLIEHQGARIGATGFDFGTVRLASPASATLFVQNVGEGPLQLERIERVGLSSVVRFGDEVVDAPVFVVPQTRALIAPGETAELPLTFLAPTVASERAQLRLWFSSSTIAEPVPFELTGQVIDATCEVEVLRDFGGVTVGEFLELPLLLKNPTSSPATVTLGPLAAGTAYDLRGAPSSFSLAASESRVVTIRFAPRSEGLFREVLPVKLSTLCDTVNVKLDGLGVADTLTWGPPANFGFVYPGRAKELTITLTNQSLLPVELSRVQLTGARFFEFVRPGVTTLTVPAARRDASGGLVAGTATIDIRFRPTILGPQTSVLSAATNLARPAQLTIPVSGFGGGPSLQVSALDLGRVPFLAGAPALTTTLELRNVGQNVTPPDPALNLQLATPWVVQPANAQSLVDELCVGTFMAGKCVNAPAAGVSTSLPRSVVLSVPVRLALQNANTDAMGVKAWDVTFTSNDPERPMVTVRITARPVALPPCNFTLTPALDFGHISEPLPKERALRLCNTGVGPADRCLLSSATARGAGFSVVDPPRDVELAPQECRSIVVRAEQPGPVPATPTTLTGTVDVRLSTQQGLASVPLVATQAVGCLVIDPSPMDFGIVALGCRSVDRTVQLFNQCNSSITITGGTLVDDGRQAFSVVTPLPQGPLTLTRGGMPVSVQLRFRPQAEGDELGAFRVSVQQATPLEHLVVLRGKGAATTRVKESLGLGLPSAADVLLVVDSSCSFAPGHAALAANFESLRTISRNQGTDVQIAATGSDAESVDCPGCSNGAFRSSDAGVRVITSATPNPQVHVAGWFQNPFGADVLVANAVHAFTAPNVFDPTRSGGLLRPGAVLGIIALADFDTGFGSPVGWQLAQLRNVKGANRPRDFSVSLIDQPNAGCAASPMTPPPDPTVVAFGGTRLSLCGNTWPRVLETAGTVAAGARDRVWLSGTPAPTPNLVVSQGGAPFANTTYQFDVVTNTVALTYGIVSTRGTIEVEYDALCLP